MDSSATRPATVNFGSVGLWRAGVFLTPQIAAEVERLGFGTIWVGGSPAADLAVVEESLDATEHIMLSTGIVNIWTAPAEQVAESFHRLEVKHPGRFVLGIGIGHREHLGEVHTKPFAALEAYLDRLDDLGVPADRRVISALGPRTLRLAAERSLGTHPYLTTPAHTQYARSILGDGPLLAPEQRLVPEEQTSEARDSGRKFLKHYLGLRNYRRTMEQHGFTADELDDGATDDAVDRLTPHGDASALAEVVRGHLSAGADHVCVQILPFKLDPLPALRALARELAL